MSAVMTDFAAHAAGGYDPANIAVLFDPPSYGDDAAVWASGGMPGVPVAQRAMPMTNPGGRDGGGSPRVRRLLALLAPAVPAPPTTGNVAPSVPPPASTANSSAAAAGGGASETEQQLRVWVSFQHLAPMDVPQLLAALLSACALGPSAASDLTASACGHAVEAGLTRAGIAVDPVSFSMRSVRQPTVSCVIWACFCLLCAHAYALCTCAV